jgi:hypothetical protein
VRAAWQRAERAGRPGAADPDVAGPDAAGTEQPQHPGQPVTDQAATGRPAIDEPQANDVSQAKGVSQVTGVPQAQPPATGKPWPRTRPEELVALVSRLILVQAGVAAAIGLSYSRRHLPSILITLMLVAALLGIMAAARSATHGAWVLAIAFESAFVAFGLFRFITSRYLGGTLLGIITLGVLLHPAVARAFSGAPRADDAPAGEGADEPLGGHAAG